MAAEESSSVRGSRGSGRYVSEQRGRLLSATFSLVGELGYEGVNARSVSGAAGVSNRTFYEVFSDREDCFLAAFNYAVDGLELEMRAGWESEPGWTATTELVATATNPAILNLAALIEETGTAITLPVRVHLKNPLLGEGCYIGSEKARSSCT